MLCYKKEVWPHWTRPWDNCMQNFWAAAFVIWLQRLLKWSVQKHLMSFCVWYQRKALLHHHTLLIREDIWLSCESLESCSHNFRHKMKLVRAKLKQDLTYEDFKHVFKNVVSMFLPLSRGLANQSCCNYPPKLIITIIITFWSQSNDYNYNYLRM